jgi:membrane protein YqaA with SNARE-associated domain
LMRSRYGLWLISLVSFIEAATPIPLLTDPFMIAGIMLNRSRVFLIVAITTISSVLGGVAAYMTAAFALNLLMQYMTPEMQTVFAQIAERKGEGTFMLTMIGAVTPIPYTTTAYVVATLQGSLLLFFIASIIGRGVRYSIVGVLVYQFGPTAIKYARRWIGWISVILIALGLLYLWINM